MAWDTSRRRDQLPPNWHDLRRQAKTRAQGICEHHTNGQRCTNTGTELHHTQDNTDHRLEVLEWICRDCHRAETQRQAREAQTARYTTAKKRHPEPHPGLI